MADSLLPWADGPGLKAYRRGTHRLVTPAETLEGLSALFPALGITRIANVTGLDHIGLPVAVACRPNARSLSVSQGKGLDLEAAKASAAMESIELHHAERIVRPLLLASMRELRHSHRMADMDGLPHLEVSTYHDDQRLLFIEGWDVGAGAGTWLPYELVHMNITLPLPPGSGCFIISSNGLASGNHPLEALCHGMAEVIERDATSLWHASSPAAQAACRLDLGSVDDDACIKVLERLERAGMATGAWETTSDVGVSSFVATIVDARPEPARTLYATAGMGCHADRGIALLRALTEAAQSRLTMISSSRDDVPRSDYEQSRNADVVARVRAEILGQRPARTFAQVPHHDAPTFVEDAEWMASRLKDAGFAQILAVDLTIPGLGIPVIRVVVPGLEPVHSLPGYVPGARARAERPSLMPIFVFLGPTMTVGEARTLLDAHYLPPASQGDVYRATREHPLAIGIVDGYFERVPAVWHKEILWAMSHGVHVLGAGSMGVLRAAELAVFGMEGIGEVYDAFARGELEDDDEVAVAHAGAEEDYRTSSDAMVNIRATLASAAAGGIVSPATASTLVAIAKETFYPERSFAQLCARGWDSGLPRLELDRLSSWLPQGRVDQKRADARALLQRLGQLRASAAGPNEVRFVFQHTDAWEQVRRELDQRPLDTRIGADTEQPDVLLDELRLEGEGYGIIRERLLARVLALEVAASEGAPIDERLVKDAAETLSRQHRLASGEEMEQWLGLQGLSAAGFATLVREEARVRRIRTMVSSELLRHLPSQLRVEGRFGGLQRRARAKQELLARHGLENPTLRDAGITEDELWRWFFVMRHGEPIPASLESHARQLDLPHLDAMRRLALRERCYLDLARSDGSQGGP